MAEYIEREALKDAFKSVTEDCTCPLHIAAEIDQILDQADAADVVEVVRGRWISVTERYPSKRGWYIVCDKSGGVKPDIYEVLDDGRSWFKSDFSLLNIGLEPYITHWMPLPEPPNCGARMDGGKA